MATPTPLTNTPQKNLAAFSSPNPRSVPQTTGINFDSPAALGLSLEGGIGMGISMSGLSGLSGLGLSASAIGRAADDEERRRRLQTVISTLDSRPGRVSQEGITALCKKLGLQLIPETRRDGTVVLAILIGNDALLEVSFKNGEVEGTQLILAADEQHPHIKFGDNGSKILLRDLRPLPGMTRTNLTLDRFAKNLERLVRMDKLSTPGANCFAAVFGVYTSLRKLFEHEKEMAKVLYSANTPNANIKAEREVLCKKSGRPRMNAADVLGLALEYWMDRRHLIPKPKENVSEKGKDKMDVDAPPDVDPAEDDLETNQIYSLVIGCESSPSSLYPPIRVSDAWISPGVEKEAADPENVLFGRPTIDWLEPPPTFLPASAPEAPEAMSLDAQPGRLPNIRFVAKFNPPLVVPLSVAVHLHQTLGNEIPPDQIRPTTFIGLALRPGETDPGATIVGGETTQELRSDKWVTYLDENGEEKERRHLTSLYVPKTEYARVLEQLPFSHPRQLIEILPTLRQYAFMTSLLKRTFTDNPSTSSPDKHQNTGSRLDDTLLADITLTYAQPTPRITLHLPHPSTPTRPPRAASLSVSNVPSEILSPLDAIMNSHGNGVHDPRPPIMISIDVLPNVEVIVGEQNVVDVDGGAADGSGSGSGSAGEVKMETGETGETDNKTKVLGKKVMRLAKGLDVSADIGVWVEWVRRGVERDYSSGE